MIRQHWFNAIATTVALAAASASALAEERYEVTDLPNYPLDTSAVATGISPEGVVVGHSEFRGNTIGFKYHPGPNFTRSLLPYGSDVNCLARAINGSGVAVGQSWGDGSSHVVRWTLPGNVPQEIHPDAIEAQAINEAGYVFGTANLSGRLRAYIWNPVDESMSILPDLGGSTVIGMDGNNRNDACGYAILEDNITYHAFLYRQPGEMIDLGTLPGDRHSYAYALNDAGQVVCRSSRTGRTRGFLYDHGQRIPLGVLDGFTSTFATDLNNRGQIVGYCEAGSERRAFLWENGSMIDLNELIDSDDGWVLEEVVAINDRGDIVGNGTLYGEPRAFVLNGLSLDVTGPCPGTITATVTGASPGFRVALEFSDNDGSYTIPRRYACNGTLVRLGLPLLPGAPVIQRANANGVVRFTGPVPNSLCGIIRFQAIDLDTCRTSNVVIHR